MKVKIKPYSECYIPKYSTKGSAGLDCFASLFDTLIISPGETFTIPLGFCIEIPDGYYGDIRPRSGLSKKGIRVSLGLLDSDYRGEVMVTIYNSSKNTYMINPKDRICQLVIKKYEPIEFEVVDSLSEPDEAHLGFGSTGN